MVSSSGPWEVSSTSIPHWGGCTFTAPYLLSIFATDPTSTNTVLTQAYHHVYRIFILEGLAPVAVSFGLFFILPDKPETARFLTKEEREFVINRIALYTGSGHGRTTNSDKVTMKYIQAAFTEWKIWAAIIPFWACSIGTYGCESPPLVDLAVTSISTSQRLPFTDQHSQSLPQCPRSSSRWATLQPKRN